MKKVVHLQFSTDSAARAALRLQRAFLEAGVDSHIVSLKSDRISHERITYMGRKSRLIAWFDDKIRPYVLRNLRKEAGVFSYPVFGTNVARIKEVREADVIYIHWALNGFLNFRSIEKLAKLRKPIIFFMHDMWAITGGCHHSFTCEKYKSQCHRCPAFHSPRKRDLSWREFMKKKRLYSKYDNFYFVSPSKWLLGCAQEAALTKDKPLFYIPNIIDKTVFQPVDKSVAKKILGINGDEVVIAFGAVALDSPYKGWPYLQKALEKLKNDECLKKVTVLIFGSRYNEKIADKVPFPVRFMGFLNDEYSMMLVYNAADVFIVPSVADNQPTTVMESMCCGTPVVGFNVGGIPDMIRHEDNGYLAIYKDAADITEGIKYCLRNNLKGRMLPDFEPATVIKKHLELFDQIDFSRNKKKLA